VKTPVPFCAKELTVAPLLRKTTFILLPLSGSEGPAPDVAPCGEGFFVKRGPRAWQRKESPNPSGRC